MPLRILILFFLLQFSGQQALAEETKNDETKKDETKKSDTHFEWGAGVLTIYANHYRGSDQWKHWIFPMPYFNYRSEMIEAEPSFIRGLFLQNDWFSFKLSLALGLNVESNDNLAREGMPSLGYTLEAGPMFIFHLWKSQAQDVAINFEWPIREGFASDFTYFKAIGLFSVPYFNFIHNATEATWKWHSEFSISPMFADKKYHNYFYGVDPQFARANRPTYRAHGGYSGFQTALVLNKRIDKLMIIPFVRWDYLDGSVFENSPLVKTKNYALWGLGLFFYF